MQVRAILNVMRYRIAKTLQRYCINQGRVFGEPRQGICGRPGKGFGEPGSGAAAVSGGSEPGFQREAGVAPGDHAAGQAGRVVPGLAEEGG
jgi:hypothetical protein